MSRRQGHPTDEAPGDDKGFGTFAGRLCLHPHETRGMAMFDGQTDLTDPETGHSRYAERAVRELRHGR